MCLCFLLGSLNSLDLGGGGIRKEKCTDQSKICIFLKCPVRFKSDEAYIYNTMINECFHNAYTSYMLKKNMTFICLYILFHFPSAVSTFKVFCGLYKLTLHNINVSKTSFSLCVEIPASIYSSAYMVIG